MSDTAALSNPRPKTSLDTLEEETREYAPAVCHGPVKDLGAMVPKAWWKTVFSDSLYLKTDGDVVEDGDITAEECGLLSRIDEVRQVLLRGADGDVADGEPSKILDLCCGQGRHSLQLLKDYPHLQVHGHDQSSYLISLAQERASFGNRIASPKFTVGDCRTIPYPDNTFDLVLLMGNSFGYFSEDEQDVRVLQEVQRVLVPNGVLVLDLTDGDYMRSHFAERSWEWADESTFVCRERQLSPDGLRLNSREIITITNRGVVRDQFYQERLYGREELCELMRMQGFVDRPGNFQEASVKFGEMSKRGEDLGMMANRMFVTAVKCGGSIASASEFGVGMNVPALTSPKDASSSSDSTSDVCPTTGSSEDSLTAAGTTFGQLSLGAPGDGAKNKCPTRPNAVPPPTFEKILVLLGDPSKPCIGKLNNTWNQEDLLTREKLKQALLNGGTSPHCIAVAESHDNLQELLSEIQPSFVFNLCDEGWNNDALKELHVPALLEILNIPYSGAGPNCLAFCYDKGLVNRSAEAIGIPVAKELTFLPDNQTPFVSQLSALAGKVDSQIGFPAFIKPIRGDNSLGITSRSIVQSEADLEAYMRELDTTKQIREVLVQEYLQGTEYGVGVIGNPETGFTFLPILEVDFTNILKHSLPPILGYESKWDPTSPYWSEISYKQVTLAPAVEKQLKNSCIALWERFGCRDYARFDFRCDVGRGDGLDGLGGTIKLLEVNPNPGWCWDGKFAYMAKLGGYEYCDMLNLILQASESRLRHQQ